MDRIQSISEHLMWPNIPYEDWKETYAALQTYLQIVGKYRLARSPWHNHSWHATFYVVPRGLTTGPIPDRRGITTVLFDFYGQRVEVETSMFRKAEFPLEPSSTSTFYDAFCRAITHVGGDATFHDRPSEVEESIPFKDDARTRPFDAEAVQRYHQALVSIYRIFSEFRTGFIGKGSPVHLFWGVTDLAVTRFSGRRAPLHPGGFPNLPDKVTREAYSHEVSSAGFWAGGNGVNEAMFYAYAYPVPDGYADASVQPGQARYDSNLNEFLLPYESVRTADDPEATLLAFLQSTYATAATLGGWDRKALECEIGKPAVPRQVS